MLVLHKGLESQDYFYTKLQGGIIVYLELLYVSNEKKNSKKKKGAQKTPERNTYNVPSPSSVKHFKVQIRERFVISSIHGSGLQLYAEIDKRHLCLMLRWEFCLSSV